MRGLPVLFKSNPKIINSVYFTYLPHSMNFNANVCLREFNQELAERPMEHLHFIEMTIVLCKYVKKKLQVWWPHTYLHTDIEYSNET